MATTPTYRFFRPDYVREIKTAILSAGPDSARRARCTVIRWSQPFWLAPCCLCGEWRMQQWLGVSTPLRRAENLWIPLCGAHFAQHAQVFNLPSSEIPRYIFCMFSGHAFEDKVTMIGESVSERAT